MTTKLTVWEVDEGRIARMGHDLESWSLRVATFDFLINSRDFSVPLLWEFLLHVLLYENWRISTISTTLLGFTFIRIK